MDDVIDGARMARARRMLDRVEVFNPAVRDVVLGAIARAFEAGFQRGFGRARVAEHRRVEEAVRVAGRHAVWIAGLDPVARGNLMDAISRGPSS